VDTNEEAQELLTRTCERVFVTRGEYRGLQFLAPELEKEQTLGNLNAFGDRLAAEYAKMKEAKA
jgi:hypothetical protein